jgi:hypothetical protein
MSDTILGFDSNTVYAVIILLILIILGVITFHYYAFISAGNKSVLSAGFGTGFTFWPKKEHMGAGPCSACENCNPKDASCRLCMSKCSNY